MAFNFPDAPIDDQTFTPSGGPTYIYKNPRWLVKGGAAGASIIVSDTAPASPGVGTLWYESDSGNTYLWYSDVDSYQWVMVASSAVAGGDFVQRSGDTMVGPLTLPADPSSALQATTKQYVDTSLGSAVVNSGVPAGAVQMFARNTPPTGWLKANGALLSRTTYAALFAAIGTTFGAGDGSTTFALPDFRGEFLRSWDDGRGTDASRTFGSAQTDDTKTHTHAISITSAGDSLDHQHYNNFSTGYISADHSHVTTTGTESADHTHAVPSGGPGGTYAGGSFAGTNTGGQTTGGRSAAHSHTGTSGGVSANHYHAVAGWTGTVNQFHTHAVTGTSGATGGTETRPRNVALLTCIKY